MFCLKCGAIIQAGATACPRCHAPVEAKKADDINSFKDYSKGDYRSDDFGKSYSADDYRQEQDAPNTKQDESPRFQLKKDSSFNLSSSDSSNFQIKSEGFSLRLSHQPESADTPAPQPPKPLAPLPEQPTPAQPTYSQPTYSQPTYSQPTPVQPSPVQPPPPTYVRPTYSSPNQPTQQPYAQPNSVPTWKEDSPDAPPTPLAAAPQPYQQPDNGASSNGTLPPLYGQSNFGTYQPDKPREPVSDHLGLSIFTTLCCCQLGGVVAIIFSVKARNALQRGDYDSARSSAKAALWISLISILLSILLWFAGTLLEAANTGSYDEDSYNEQEQYLNIEPEAQEEGTVPRTKLNIDPKNHL